ncbi:MAG TPA: ATP-binding protein, partial [Caulifigura sp.]|nr:ATP-binding protein [Caulifigura sp.]
LNNVLSIIFGYCDLAGQSTGSPDCVEQILLAAEKGARIVRQLLSSGRTSRHDLATFEVAEALTELKPLLNSLTGPTISLVIERPAHEAFPVRMPRTDFDQVLLNLVANARDAMPDGGTLRCVLERYEPELRDLKLNPGLHPAPCVRLSVIDAGCGMTEETRRRIFEPFFTTKTGDRGTGVGLSTVRQIVDRAAGGITVATVPGKGTAVSVLLPRALSELSPRMVDIPAQVDPRGSESVLIVCEDARMRELLARLLQVRGYRVTGLASFAEVETHRRQAPGPVDLLLAEAAMIDRWAGSGTTFKGNLPPRLLRIGDIDAPAGQAVSGFGFVQTLVKPFTSQQLAIAVREALGDSIRPPAVEVTA